MTDDLKFLEVGQLFYARWLTLGSRVLRFYVSQHKPSTSLRTPAEFLLKVYFSSLFNIKINCKITHGATNFFYIVTRMNKFRNRRVQKIIEHVLQGNVFLAHAENVFLAMLSDNDEKIRRIAVNKILKIRRANQMKEADEPQQTSSSDNTFSSSSKKKKFGSSIYHILISQQSLIIL